MLRDAFRRRCDVVMVWAVDRLGRSLPDLVGTMQELHGAKVGLFIHQQGLDTTTPAGRAMFGMLGVFAEFERAMIQSRVAAGLARARAAGVRLGRTEGGRRDSGPSRRRGRGPEDCKGTWGRHQHGAAREGISARHSGWRDLFAGAIAKRKSGTRPRSNGSPRRCSRPSRMWLRSLALTLWDA